MYIRTTTRKLKNGTPVKYYQLAHNERDPKTKNPVAKVIHSFGRVDEVDRDALVRLCKSIGRICGLEVAEPEDKTAQNKIENLTGISDDVEQIRTVEFGTVLVIEAIWEQFGIGKVLRQVAQRKECKIPYERALLAMTANRICEPESKLGVWDRWLKKVYLPSCNELKLAHMYEAMDLLYEYSADVEKAIYYKTADLLNIVVDLIFYDTTVVPFAIDNEDIDQEDEVEGLRKYGHANDGSWNIQIRVALAVTREGLPVRCWVFPGNTTDVKTVKRVKSDLKEWKLGRTLFVSDSGMNSADNRQELSKACGKYLMASRMGSVSEIKKEVLPRGGRYKRIKDNLYAKEVIVGNGERRRRYILCYNPK